MKKKIIMEGTLENGILRIPVMDLFVKDIVQKAKRKMFDDIEQLLKRLDKEVYKDKRFHFLLISKDWNDLKKRHLPTSEKKAFRKNPKIGYK